jgi:hypothetical protein
MSVLLTGDQIMRDVAFLRGKPSNANDGSASAATATGAVAINGGPIAGGTAVPNYLLRSPPVGRQYVVGANAQNPGRLPGHWVPAGYVCRYPDEGLQTLRGDPDIVLDGELVPEAVSVVRYLIGLVCDNDFNVNVGDSSVTDPAESGFYAGRTHYYFYAGYGTGVTHMNLIATPALKYTWWYAGGGAPLL